MEWRDLAAGVRKITILEPRVWPMGNGMESRRPRNRSPIHQVHEPGGRQDGERQDGLREAEKCTDVDY